MPTIRPRATGGDVRERDGRIQAGALRDKDSLVSALVKWIPIEVIAFYEGITTPFGTSLAGGLLYAIAAGFVVTFLWIAFATESTKASSHIAWRQTVLSSVAFAFWVTGTTSPEIWKL